MEVSDQGRMRRSMAQKDRAGWIYKPRVGWRGYEYLLARCVKPMRVLTIHSEVLKAFLGPRPIGFDASHINGKRRDNRACNLTWESRSDNILRKREHGTMVRGEKHKCAKLRADQVVEMRARRDAGVGLRELSGDYGVSETRISLIVRRKAWTHLLNEGNRV